jgi:hypothetical protein
MLPVDDEDWKELASLHNLSFPNTGRVAAKLKHKFQKLYQVKMQTANPMSHPEVRMAKRIQEQNWDNSDIHNGKDELTLQAPHSKEMMKDNPLIL